MIDKILAALVAGTIFFFYTCCPARAEEKPPITWEISEPFILTCKLLKTNNEENTTTQVCIAALDYNNKNKTRDLVIDGKNTPIPTSKD